MQLYLCEKPSQAKDIAKVLGIHRRANGYIDGGDRVVTWAVGHLLETASPEAYGKQYRHWRMDTLPILPDPWQMIVKQDTAEQFSVIRSLLGKSGEVIIATDADREGEVIARELLEYCHYKGKIKRLWLSALDETSVREALKNILPGEKTEALYAAGKCRSQADWLTGMNLSRLYTLKKNIKGQVISVGRVQTPTLALVVKRDRAIENFVPVPWFKILTTLSLNGKSFQAEWMAAEAYCDHEKRCIHAGAAKQVLALCQNTTQATVIDCQTRRQKTSAPLVFSLSSLQQACSKKYGISAQRVLEIAQTLYEKHKLTTYPRTDCGYLPRSMHDEIPHVLAAIVKTDPQILSVVKKLDAAFTSRVWNDKKITAHHGIIPTRKPGDITQLTADERRVYELIRLHYLAQFLPVMESDITEASFNMAGQLFHTKGTVVIIPGWSILFTNTDHSEDTTVYLPAMHSGCYCIVSSTELKSLMTSPPPPYEDGTLIAAMTNAATFVTDSDLKKILKETAGLGTEATRAGIVDTLLKRGFLLREKKVLHATEAGKSLVDALPAALTSPGLTALWEQLLDEVACGHMTLKEFMDKQTQWIMQLVTEEKNR